MKLNTFQAWCTAKAIQTSLQINESDQGFRYTTLRDDVSPPASADRFNLLQIPIEACITAGDSEGLVDRLAFEKSLGAASDYAPYIDTMPSLESFQMPRFWSTQRLESVTDGGQLERELNIDQLRYRKDPWALACVDSRCHFLPDGSYSLTPVLDMINHGPTVETSLRVDRESDEDLICLDVSGKSLVFETSPDTSPMSWMNRLLRPEPDTSRNNEVCISYGDFTNIYTLLNYGFVFPENPCNSENVPIRFIRQQSPVTLIVKSDGSIDEEGLGRLRRAVASPEERDLVDTLPANQKSPLLFVSQRNEEEVLGLVAGELELAMEQASEGALQAKQDELVALYLRERSQALQRGLERIQNLFPE